MNSISQTTVAGESLTNYTNEQKDYIFELKHSNRELISGIEESTNIAKENVKISEELTSQAEILKEQLNKFKV